MGDYVLLDGVRSWYEERGDGDPLVLLHPGGGRGTHQNDL